MPARDQAYVPYRKVAEYLLSDSHVHGRPKARFFRAVGYSQSRLGELAEGLLAIGRNLKLPEHYQTGSFGTKIIKDGWLYTPVSRTVRVRTVWLVEKHDYRTRLITAYPIK